MMRLSLAIPIISTLSFGTRNLLASNVSAFAVNGIGKQEAATNTFTSTTARNMSSDGNKRSPVDPDFPGTAVERMMNIRARVKELALGDDLNQSWEEVRRKLLWAGGLRDLTNVAPGRGYTGHAFNDFNHVDLTAMLGEDKTNNGEIDGIAKGNFLGEGIRVASLPELGPGGSWSTCALGCNRHPPQDVAHVSLVQCDSKIALSFLTLRMIISQISSSIVESSKDSIPIQNRFQISLDTEQGF